jgi:hypothetical protein
MESNITNPKRWTHDESFAIQTLTDSDGARVATAPQLAWFGVFSVFGMMALSVFAARAEEASRPEDVQPEPATLHCLAVRWVIRGDDNENASVQVECRRVGDAAWRRGYPLYRTIRQATPDQRKQWNFSGLKPERFPGGRLYAGSIVELTPDTEYDVKLTLADPDGGGVEKALRMRTLGEPKEPPGMHVRHVVPGEGGGSGTEQDPFRGVQTAAAAMEAGDLFLLHQGVYAVQEPLTFARGGEPGKPIIFRGAGDGEAAIDGGGDPKTPGRLISAPKTRHVWIEDLTLRGRQYLIVAHEGSNWVLRRCRFLKMEKAFTAHNGGYEVSRGHFISDNVFVGPTTWPRMKGIEAPCAAILSGAGHVVCYNRMEHLGDGVHGTGHGNLSASDIHHNEIVSCTDDGIEADYGETNIRVYRNRIVNVIHGVSAQPAQGGPFYFFRNVIYNATYSPFKLHNDTCGVFLFHNTALRNGPCFIIQPAHETVTDVRTRNNLFIGTRDSALHTTGRMIGCDFDADGYGGFEGEFARWNGKGYRTWEEARAAGGLYKTRGAVLVDPASCFASGLLPPGDPNTEFMPAALDFRLKEGSGAIDRGEAIPNFSDGFRGSAPDLGAIEFGDPMPPVGPRAPAMSSAPLPGR